MSSLVAWVPTLVQTSASLQQRKDAKLNSRLLRDQSRAERSAAAADEAAQRRASRLQLGRQIAATGEAGGGYGGSSGLLLEQSAVLAELDALNIRYGGELRAKGLLAESMVMKQRARSAGTLAGAQLLMGGYRAYTGSKIAEG